MTSKEINKLWAETYVIGALAFERVHKFAALVAAAEREACAKVCEDARSLPDVGPLYCAVAIRARGDT